MKTKYLWKAIRTTGIELTETLNEIEEKTDWTIFNIFSHPEKTEGGQYNGLVVVLRKPRRDDDEEEE